MAGKSVVVKKITNVQAGTAALECFEGEQAWVFTLHPTDGSADEILTACVPLDATLAEIKTIIQGLGVYAVDDWPA